MKELCAQLSSRRLRELSIRERSEEAVKMVYACRAGAQAAMERDGLTLLEMWHTSLQSDSNARALGVAFHNVAV
jgi:hypothetical protein